MAIVRSINKGTQIVKIHPTEVDLFYQVVVNADGEPYVHLTTFGSQHRATAPKSSQSIQLNATMAAELVTLLVETFGL